MTGETQQIGTDMGEVDIDLSDGLRRIRVKQDTMAVAGLGYLAHGLDDAGLVIGVHDRDERRFGPQGLRDDFRPNAAI